MLPPPGSRHAPLLALLLLALSLDLAAGSRKQPPKPLPAVVQALQPSGLRISVLDEEGMDVVIIGADINKRLQPKETGRVSQTMWRAKDGFWTLSASEVELKPEDVVYYWLYYSIRGTGRFFTGNHKITELVDPSCEPSITTVDGEPVCRGALVFEDNFDSSNESAWEHVIQFSDREYRTFNTYLEEEENSFIKDGFLHLKATVEPNEDELSKPLVLEGCTALKGGEYCERNPLAWDIRPPTRSAWVLSGLNFNFRFGRVEVRAKPAVGDWLLSRVWLESHDDQYGVLLKSGRIELLHVKGNQDLRLSKGGNNVGANLNEEHVGLATCHRDFFFRKDHSLAEGLFTDGFHSYGLSWTQRGITTDVDGVKVLDVERPLPGGFLDIEPFRNCSNSPWERGSLMAPFDKEFYINIALLVGGQNTFEDESISGENVKPYSDNSPRGPLNFLRQKDAWLPTWKDDFMIDYVKVWAL